MHAINNISNQRSFLFSGGQCVYTVSITENIMTDQKIQATKKGESLLKQCCQYTYPKHI